MSKIIIIDGPDGAGKTTLMKKLLEQFPEAAFVHFGVPADYTKQYAVYADTILNIKADVVIMDRSWYSDRVYGPIMRNREEMTLMQSQTLDRIVQLNGGGMVIYCTAPIEVLWQRCQARGETYIENIEQLDNIRMAYETVMHTSELPVVRFDTGAGF